jgi:hypothetical protein
MKLDTDDKVVHKKDIELIVDTIAKERVNF